MTGNLHSLSHVALKTTGLEESLEFFNGAVGMEIVERDGDDVYLRAPDEFQHHSIVLSEAGEAGVDHVGWQAADPESVTAFGEYFEDLGLDVTWVEADEERGQGEAVRFVNPFGHRFEIFYRMDNPEPPEARRSKLRNKPYAETTTNPIAPRRIDHVQIWDTEAHDLAQWMLEHMDMRVQESYDLTDGSRWGTFVSASGVKIEAAVIQHEEPDGDPSLNHIAYKVDTEIDLYAAADAMRELGYPNDGIGQHSISRGKFYYARDPVSDHTIEFNAGGYLVFDPDWDPVRWQQDDLKRRQWIGQITGGVNVPY